MEDKRVIIPGRVLDNTDPLMLGRLRVLADIENELQALPQDWDPVKDIWTYKDPFVFLPLIPYYISQVPKEGEYVNIIYSTRKEIRGFNKFYIQGPLSRPWNNSFEKYENSKSLLDSGNYLKQAKSIKNKNTGVIEPPQRGIYPEPGDNAFLGRGTTDLLIKEDDIILRAGKYTTSPNNEIPTANDFRSFLQLSNFGLERIDNGTEDVETEIYVDKQVKNFIEWVISDIDSNLNVVSGYVQTNSIKGDVDQTKVLNFEIKNSTLNNCVPIIDSKMEFTGLTPGEVISFVNQYIRGFNKGIIKIPTYTTYPNNGLLFDQFPFVFGPNVSTNDKMLGTNPLESNIITEIFNGIKLNPASDQPGFAVVWDKGVVGPQKITVTKTIDLTKYVENPVTYGIMGGDFLYLLSHKSNNSNKQISLKDTLYGINQEKILDDIKPKTSSMVRGEELLDLIGLIVSFLQSHTHNINEAPIQEPGNGVTMSKITQELANAKKTILNENIRIN